MKPVQFLFAAALVLGCSAGRAADFKKTGPMAPSSALIAARGAVQEPGLEFVYKIEGGDAPGTVTFDLAQDFSVVDAGDALTIYDYALKRVIVLNDKAHTFRNNSLYGMIDARGGAVGGMDATFEPSKQAIGKEEGARLAKLLRATSPLAPAAIDRIAASGYLPQTLSFGSGKAGMTWTLQMSAAVKDAYPLASSARPPKPDPADAQKALGDAFALALSAAGGEAPGKRTQEDFRGAVEAALAHKHPFQALLLSAEMIGEYGPGADSCTDAKHCHSIKAITAAAAHDPRTARLRAATRPAKDRLDAAIKTLKTMKRDDLANATMLDEYLADDLAAAGRGAEAQPLFIAALKANPYMPGFYKELGDFYRANSQPILAWACYDLGRALPNAATAPALLAVTDQEAQMEKKYPELF